MLKHEVRGFSSVKTMQPTKRCTVIWFIPTFGQKVTANPLSLLILKIPPKNVKFDWSTLEAMNIAGKKMELIEWLVRLQDEKLIQRIENLKNDARREAFEKRTPKTIEDVQSKLKQSESDISSGRVYAQEEVENYFKGSQRLRLFTLK